MCIRDRNDVENIWDLIEEEVDPDSCNGDTSVETTDVNPIQTILLPLSSNILPAYNIAAPPPQAFAVLRAEMQGVQSYNWALIGREQEDGPEVMVNIRCFNADFDFPNLNSYEDLALQINEQFEEKRGDIPVNFFWNGVAFVIRATRTDYFEVRVHDHATEFGGSIIKFDNRLGFTTGSFGDAAPGSIRATANTVLGQNIIMGSQIREPLVSLSGIFEYVIDGMFATVQIDIVDGDSIHDVAAKIQAAVPDATCYYDGKVVIFTHADITRIEATPISTLLGLTAEVGASLFLA